MRLQGKGLTTVLCSMARYMYKPNHAAPPKRALLHLEILLDENSSLVM